MAEVTTNTNTYVWAKEGREKLKLKYEASQVAGSTYA